MENFGLKFSLYDFFGYFIPGFICILLIILTIFFIEINKDKNTDGKFVSANEKIEYANSRINDKIFIVLKKYKELILKIKFVFYIPILIITYVLGHIIYSAGMIVRWKWRRLSREFTNNKEQFS